MGVEPKIGGKPPKWMVKIMENPMNKWMIWGVFPLFLVQHPYEKMAASEIPTFKKFRWPVGLPGVGISRQNLGPYLEDHPRTWFSG